MSEIILKSGVKQHIFTQEERIKGGSVTSEVKTQVVRQNPLKHGRYAKTLQNKRYCNLCQLECEHRKEDALCQIELEYYKMLGSEAGILQELKETFYEMRLIADDLQNKDKFIALDKYSDKLIKLIEIIDTHRRPEKPEGSLLLKEFLEGLRKQTGEKTIEIDFTKGGENETKL